MRLWIDGGTLHAAHRCLLGKGAPEDADNLLHLASCLPFAQEVLIGSYGGGTYSERSQDALSYLARHFDTERYIREIPVDAESTERLYLAAASDIAIGVESKLSRVTTGDTYAWLDPARMDMEALFYQLIRSDMTEAARRDLYERVKDKQNNGLIVMLTKNDAFWSAIRNLVRNFPAWSDDHGRRLATACRSFVHVESARKFASVYSPNAQRGASLMALSNEGFPGSLWRKIQGLPNAAVKDLPNIGLPPFAAYIALKSDGDPFRAVAEAINLRETTASPLLNCLRLKFDQIQTKSKTPLAINIEYEKLVADLSDYLVKGSRGRLLGAGWAWVKAAMLVMSAFSSGAVDYKDLSVSLKKAITRTKRLADLQNVIALGEISALLRFDGLNDQPYQRLRQAASKNR